MSLRRVKLFAWALALVAGFPAMPALANTCAPAAVQGTAPADFQGYCWLDFSGYSDALAQAGGQPFSFALPDGSILTLTVQVSTNKTNPALAAHAVPSWTGSAWCSQTWDPSMPAARGSWIRRWPISPPRRLPARHPPAARSARARDGVSPIFKVLEFPLRPFPAAVP
jgi:hypothetical protein